MLIYIVNIKGGGLRSNIYDSAITIIFFIVIALYLGVRDYDIGTDTVNYIRDFRYIEQQPSLTGALDTIRRGSDPLFTVLTFYISRLFSEQEYLLLLTMLFLVPIAIFIFKLTKGRRSLLLLAFLSLYSFKYMAINTIRSGIAMSFALLAMYVFFHRKHWLKILSSSILPVVLHVSSLIFIVPMIAVRYVKNVNVFYLLILLTSILSFIGFGLDNIPIVAQALMESERASSYIEGNERYQTGFSITYWLYNFIVFLYAVYFSRKIDDDFYSYLMRLFIFLTSIYYLCFNIAYNDRIGVYSWMLIPILITYPFIKKNIFGKIGGGIVISLLLIFQLMAILYLNR